MPKFYRGAACMLFVRRRTRTERPPNAHQTLVQRTGSASHAKVRGAAINLRKFLTLRLARRYYLCSLSPRTSRFKNCKRSPTKFR